MRKLLSFLLCTVLFACTNEIDNEVVMMELSEKPLVLSPIGDSVSMDLMSYNELDPSIDNYENYEGPYSMTVTIGSTNIPNYNNTEYLYLKARVPVTYVISATGFKRVLYVGTMQTWMEYPSGGSYYLMWTDLGSRAWSTTAFTDYDQLTPYVNFILEGAISGSSGFFSPYEEADEQIRKYGSININYEY